MADFDSVNSYGYGTRGIVAFDANNDGWMDLYGASWGPAEKRFPPPGGSEGASIITPVQPNEFYINRGDGTFRRVTNSGATPDNPAWMGTQGCTVIDADEDGNMDIFVAHRNYVAIDPDSRQKVGGPTSRKVYNQLFFGDGNGRFSENASGAGLNTNPKNDCNGATFADFDNDGDYDAFIVPKDIISSDYVRVYKNDGTGHFSDITNLLKITQFGFSLIFLDADNDGDLDIVAPQTRDYTRFYRNNGDGTFTLQDDTGLRLKSFDPRGSAVGDIDNDGDLDLYYTDAIKEFDKVNYPDTVGNHLFVNTTRTSNRWLKITGRGPKGDRGGFGAKIWIYERGHMDDPAHLVGYRQVINAYGYLCQDDPVQHFGLGQRDSVEIKVRMLDRSELKLYGVPAKQRLFFSRPRKIAGISGYGQVVDAGSALPQPLVVQVKDAFGNAVYGAGVTFTPATAGGSFSESQPVYTDAQGYARVHFTPASEPASQSVSARLVDEAEESFTFTCSVKPLVIPNRTPEIVSWAPADSELFVNGYHVLEFSLLAIDADGDSLRYLWLLDGIIAGTESTFRIYPASSKTGKVEVQVRDGEHTVSHLWAMHLLTGVGQNEIPVTDFALGQNYPNPFNPQTQINFQLPRAGIVRIAVYNTAGQTVRTLADGLFPAGRHTVTWNARDDQGQPLPTGLYYYTMESGDFKVIKKLLYVK